MCEVILEMNMHPVALTAPKEEYRDHYESLLRLLHDLLLSQYHPAGPTDEGIGRTRLMVWGGRLLLHVLQTGSSLGQHKPSAHLRGFASLPLSSMGRLQTNSRLQEHIRGQVSVRTSLARGQVSIRTTRAILKPSYVDLTDKHDLWTTILADWIRGGVTRTPGAGEQGPRPSIDLALLGIELLKTIDQQWAGENDGLEDKRELDSLRDGPDREMQNWSDLSIALLDSVPIRDALVGLMSCSCDPRLSTSRADIVEACLGVMHSLYGFEVHHSQGYNVRLNTPQLEARLGVLVTSNLLPTVLTAMETVLIQETLIHHSKHKLFGHMLRWCCFIGTPNNTHSKMIKYVLRTLLQLTGRAEVGYLTKWAQQMVQGQRWSWPLMVSEGIIPAILQALRSTKDPHGLPVRIDSVMAGVKTLKRLSTVEAYSQDIRNRGGHEILIDLLVSQVCETNTECDFEVPWLAAHALGCLSNLALPGDRPFAQATLAPDELSWPATLIWRAIEVVMRVLKRTQSQLEALVAGVRALVNLVQLQVPALHGPAESSWAVGRADNKNPLLPEHSGGALGSCPKAIASMMEGSLGGLSLCLRRATAEHENKHQCKFLHNTCARLLDMLCPPGWLRLKDVPDAQHQWICCPMRYIHDNFPALTHVKLRIRRGLGDMHSRTFMVTEASIQAPMGSSMGEMIRQGLLGSPFGRLSSYRNNVVCPVALTGRTRQQLLSTPVLTQSPPIPHDKTLALVMKDIVGLAEQTCLMARYGHGPVPQDVRAYANATIPTITMWIPSWDRGHTNRSRQECFFGERGGTQHLSPLSPQPLMVRSPTTGISAGKVDDRNPYVVVASIADMFDPLNSWSLSLPGPHAQPGQDWVQQNLVLILDARDDSLKGLPAPEATHALHFSIQATTTATVAEITRAAWDACPQKEIYGEPDTSNIIFTIGDGLANDLRASQHDPPGGFRTEKESWQTREIHIAGRDRLGRLQVSPRPTLLAFLPQLMQSKDALTANDGSKVESSSRLVRGETEETASCFALNTMVLLSDGSATEVQNLTGQEVRTSDGGTARVIRIHQFHVNTEAPAQQLRSIQSNVLSSCHYVYHDENSAPDHYNEASSRRAMENIPHVNIESPCHGDWVRMDGTSWWRYGRLHHLPTSHSPTPLGQPVPSQGSALFNIQLIEYNQHKGVVLVGRNSSPGAAGGDKRLHVATMGNGVCKLPPRDETNLFGMFTKLESNDYMFTKLERTLAQLGMTDEGAITWAPGALSYCAQGNPTLHLTHLIPTQRTLVRWTDAAELNTLQKSIIAGSIHGRTFAIKGYAQNIPTGDRPQGVQDSHQKRIQHIINESPLNWKTWIEEWHKWLQFNPLAVSMANEADMETPILAVAKGNDWTGNHKSPGITSGHQAELAIILEGALRARFKVDLHIPIHELKSQLIVRLDLGKVDYIIGRLQGPMWDTSLLCEYIWEESKLICMVPVGKVGCPAGINMKAGSALKQREEMWLASTDHTEWRKLSGRKNWMGTPENRLWNSPEEVGRGAVAVIHSLTTTRSQPLHGKICLITKRITSSDHSQPSQLVARIRTQTGFTGDTWSLKKMNLSLLWWRSPELKESMTRLPPLPLLEGQGAPMIGDLVRIRNFPKGGTAFYVNGAIAVLTSTSPVPLEYEAAILTATEPDERSPTGHILLPRNCFELLAPGSEVSRVLASRRLQEAALGRTDDNKLTRRAAPELYAALATLAGSTGRSAESLPPPDGSDTLG